MNPKLTTNNKDVLIYLLDILNNLNIETYGKRNNQFYSGNIFDLASKDILEGWCWETTESAIVFFKDDDYIERGYLDLNENTTNYYHSWICFKYNNIEYVFDPCLFIVCKKKNYIEVLNARVLGSVTAARVKEELIRQVSKPKKKDTRFENLFKDILGDSYEEHKKRVENEVIVDCKNDVNFPFYRNGAGYKTEIENDKIKKITVHYYFTEY